MIRTIVTALVMAAFVATWAVAQEESAQDADAPTVEQLQARIAELERENRVLQAKLNLANHQIEKLKGESTDPQEASGGARDDESGEPFAYPMTFWTPPRVKALSDGTAEARAEYVKRLVGMRVSGYGEVQRTSPLHGTDIVVLKTHARLFVNEKVGREAIRHMSEYNATVTTTAKVAQQMHVKDNIRWTGVVKDVKFRWAARERDWMEYVVDFEIEEAAVSTIPPE